MVYFTHSFLCLLLTVSLNGVNGMAIVQESSVVPANTFSLASLSNLVQLSKSKFSRSISAGKKPQIKKAFIDSKLGKRVSPSSKPSAKPSARPSARPVPVPSASASAAAARKRALLAEQAKRTVQNTDWRSLDDSLLCPAGHRACPIFPRMASFECIEEDELESCGGCVSQGRGQNCLTIPGVMGVSCSFGSCNVHQCKPTHKLVTDSEGISKCIKKM